jgi:hypothetical protein
MMKIIPKIETCGKTPRLSEARWPSGSGVDFMKQFRPKFADDNKSLQKLIPVAFLCPKTCEFSRKL